MKTKYRVGDEVVMISKEKYDAFDIRERLSHEDAFIGWKKECKICGISPEGTIELQFNHKIDQFDEFQCVTENEICYQLNIDFGKDDIPNNNHIKLPLKQITKTLKDIEKYW